MMPRKDGIILGGTSERGVWTLDPSEEERKRVVDAHIALFAGMRPMAPGTRPAITTSSAPHDVPRLESYFNVES